MQIVALVVDNLQEEMDRDENLEIEIPMFLTGENESWRGNR